MLCFMALLLSLSSPGLLDAGYYGSGIQAYSLSDTGIGKYPGNQRAAIRFRCDHSGTLSAVKVYLMHTSSDSGYSAGDGGSYRVELRDDDGTSGHFPSGAALASAILTDPKARGYFPVIAFSKPAGLRQGALYHIVFTNTDPSPAVNWVSLNSLRVVPVHGTPPTPRQPAVSDDFAVHYGPAGGPFKLRPGMTPIFQLYYSDGYKAGMGYMEVMINNQRKISGASSVREGFTVSGSNRVVTGVAVRLSRSSGKSGLVIRLEDADGTLVEEKTVPASSLTGAHDWVKVDFSRKRTLAPGKGYNLVLKTAPDTVYSIYTVERGTGYGFDPNTYFHDGYAQFTAGSGWTGWTKTGTTDMKNTDLQFYFKVR